MVVTCRLTFRTGVGDFEEVVEGILVDMPKASPLYRALGCRYEREEIMAWLSENIGREAQNVMTYTRFTMDWMIHYDIFGNPAILIRDPNKVMILKLTWL